MTESADESVAAEPIEETDRSAASLDQFLLELIHLVNSASEESVTVGIPITLSLSGGTITGQLIGYVDWMRLYTKYWETALEGTGGEAFTTPFRNAIADLEAGKKPSPTTPRFIHLRDARFFAGQVLVPTTSEGLLWRARLSDVIGFSMGSLAMG